MAGREQEEEIRFFNGDYAESLKEKAKTMLGVFHESFDPSVSVLGIEEFFEVDLGNRLPPLNGYIDLIEQNADGTITIVDLKTASRKPSESQVHQNMPLSWRELIFFAIRDARERTRMGVYASAYGRKR